LIVFFVDANALFSAVYRPQSAPILAASIDAGCDWLVTADRRDFGHLFGSNQRGVLVISPSEALRRLIDQLQFEG